MKINKNKATTFRLTPEVNAALEAISDHIGVTKNKIVNEALADYLQQRGKKLQAELDSTLKKLGQYRAEDPGFENGIEQFARAEAFCSENDTHEGSVSGISGKGSLNQKIHELIDA